MSTSKMIIEVARVVLISIVATTPVQAFQGNTTIASLRQEESSSKPKPLQMKGVLTCHYGSENRGEACALQFVEDGTGRVFRLEEPREARSILSAGHRKVALEAMPAGPETLHVTRMSVLE